MYQVSYKKTLDLVKGAVSSIRPPKPVTSKQGTEDEETPFPAKKRKSSAKHKLSVAWVGDT